VGDEAVSSAAAGDAEIGDEAVSSAAIGGAETGVTAGPPDPEDLFASEIRMLENLIKSQRNMLRTVHNGQEDALAGLTESMNELLDTYASSAASGAARGA
jgi:ABC-type transporter Mla subunit MlaD